MAFLGYFIGLLVGIILGLLGGGGSLLVVVMVLVFAITPTDLATAYIGILVGVSACISAIPRIKQGLVDWPTVWALGIPVTIGMLLVRLVLVNYVQDISLANGVVITTRTLVLLLMAALILLSFATMVGLIGKNFKPRTELKNENPAAYFGILIVAGLLIGILPGFAGAGGGRFDRSDAGDSSSALE